MSASFALAIWAAVQLGFISKPKKMKFRWFCFGLLKSIFTISVTTQMKNKIINNKYDQTKKKTPHKTFKDVIKQGVPDKIKTTLEFEEF